MAFALDESPDHRRPKPLTRRRVSSARETVRPGPGGRNRGWSDATARLRAIQELSLRLNRIRDVEGIGEAIVAEADRLIAHDSIRVYRVDHARGRCEPVAFEGEFAGVGRPSLEQLRVRIGEGLTGWVAAHNESVRIGDATGDPRARRVCDRADPESMLLVPMAYESRVLGVIVVAQTGRDQFSEDDQRTLEIFAGQAAQALVNAEAFAQVRRQQQELHHRLESQRRLLEVNERLLATLDPGGVLEMIADSLKAVVAYDALTIYRVDLVAGLRRAVVARDRFADLILAYEGPVDVGLTGWVVRHREAVLANDAHLDPRSAQIPGTPEEPESMIVCPLLIAGEVIGTLNVARMGGVDSHFSHDEFELVQLFAAQASIALRNAEAHGAVMTRAERDALTGLRNHGAFQIDLGALVDVGEPFGLLMLDLDAFKAYNDRRGHPEGDALLARAAAAMTDVLRDTDRVYRYGGDEFAILLPDVDALEAHEIAERVRSAVAALTETDGPLVTISAGAALYPVDGRSKDDLVSVADRALYLSKPADRGRLGPDDPTRDLYLAAVDRTTLGLLAHTDPTNLLRDVVARATELVGVEHGYLYLLDPDGDKPREMTMRVGIGGFADSEGFRLPRTTGLAWAVVRSGGPVIVDDYAAYPGRVAELEPDRFGAVCAVPLSGGGEVTGCLGLASGDPTRTFSAREVAALARFAQLASIAIDHSRLLERAVSAGTQRAHDALHDVLTGLPNRARLISHLATLTAHPLTPGAASRSRVALVALDLDRFTMVNESLGHVAGDQLLVQVGARLNRIARATDLVARVGSDEFGVVLGRVRDARDAGRIAERLRAAISAPFDLGGREVSVGVRLGLAVEPHPPASPADLLKEAEIALHRAKADPIQSIVRFDPEMRAQTLERAELERDLRRAIDRSELRLHYQPLVDLATGAVVGVEALLRWQHPVRGLVSPLSFIPLAEETGLIVPIGAWVLETACRQAVAWRRFGAAAPSVVSVNLSARQFGPTLVPGVAATLERAGLDPSALELEITESVVMEQSEAAIERLRSLRRLGVRLVLDDFGTGYSSLSYLRTLPLDTIKMDRSFVSGLGTNSADVPIARAVISLAHGLGIGVVAEGIETSAQLDSLRVLGCDRGQGYVFSRPQAAEDLDLLFERAAGRLVLRPTDVAGGPVADRRASVSPASRRTGAAGTGTG